MGESSNRMPPTEETFFEIAGLIPRKGDHCPVPISLESIMDKDRVKGSAKQAGGAVKEAFGKVTGDVKMESEGKAQKTAGKVQNAVGGIKDAARGK